MAVGILVALVICIFAFFTVLHVTRKVIPLVLNGILGMAAFWALNYAGLMHIPMDWVSFAVAALGGVLGVLLIMVLAALGVPF